MTLFYIFYSMNGELHQALAAEDLHRREWRFDATTSTWAKLQNTVWIKFDPSSWTIVECRNEGWNFVEKNEIRTRKSKPGSGK